MNLDENENKKEIIEKATKILEESEDKATAIAKVVEMFAASQHSMLIEEIKMQAEKASFNEDYRKKLNLRKLSEEEKKFYEKLKNIKQAVQGDQINQIPTSIVDLTMESVKTEEPVLKLINFAPVGVKRWIIAEKTGAYSWNKLTDKLKGELTANIKGIVTEIAKLNAYLVIPKAIRELSYEFIDKYFMAILNQVIREGIAGGYLKGNGKDQPIGIYYKVDSVQEGGDHNEKEVNTDLVDFSPKGLAKAKAYLTNEGTRRIDKLYVVCNPEDEANYVAPAIYDRRGNLASSFKNIEVIQCTENPKGKAALTIEGKYTMAIDNIKIDTYDQTLAQDDADLIVAKAYGNGRAVDDNVAYVFDVTKLEEFVDEVKVINEASEAV